MMFRRRLRFLSAEVASSDLPSDSIPSDKKNTFVHRLRDKQKLIAVFVASVLAGLHHKNQTDNSSLSMRPASWFDVPRSKFAIVQFDGRDPWSVDKVGPNDLRYTPTIHNIGSIWNNLYSKRHGHEYILYHWGKNSGSNNCRSNDNQTLAEAWCKIKAMLQVQTHFPNVDYFIYLDTDAVVDIKFHDQPLNNLLHNMTTQWSLEWNIDTKPFTLNMEGPSVWCRRVSDANFTNCINTGTVLWKRSVHSTKILEHWWKSADDSYDTNNPLGYKFRTETPWEQVKAQYLLTDPMYEYIQVVPQPHARMQGLPGVHKGFCLSDCWLPPMWEQLGCFVLHYGMKNGMVETYGEYVKEYLKEHAIPMNEACYPRAMLSLNNETLSSPLPTVDVAPCHPEWVGYGQQVVNINLV